MVRTLIEAVSNVSPQMRLPDGAQSANLSSGFWWVGSTNPMFQESLPKRSLGTLTRPNRPP